MKILHTSDWHVGKVLKGQSRAEEHKQVLAQVIEIAQRERPDLVIVAGDLYDTAAPTPEATRLVTRALTALRRTGADVVAIGGNHDNGAALDALRPWAEAAGITLRGSVRENPDEHVVDGVTAGGERWRLAALPFLSQRYAVRAVEMYTLTPAEANQTYADHLGRVLDRLAEGFAEPDRVHLVTAHLTVVGASTGGGERDAHTVLGYAVPATVFPGNAHYVALGHLHRSQRVIGPCPIRYSGSPLAVDFGEQENVSSVTIVEVTADHRRPHPGGAGAGRGAAAHGTRHARAARRDRAAGGLAARLRPGAAPGRAARGGAGDAAPGAGDPDRPGDGARAGQRDTDRPAGRAVAGRVVRRLPGQPRARRRGCPGALRRAARGGGALMRPMRLDMAGFTVFRDETTVDFTDADFFALVGPTGSGKSTVLDAICFALYGTVPRWGGARGLANALAPSATEARVRLVFESAGDRYVATRVVRRDGRGTVKTANAGLQLMPPGFDVTKLDTGLSPEDLGEVVAGTPAEMEQAVLDAVGLPYEQFTSCVVLPQGQFADFLHAKPATRQQILVNLLGLGVYEKVQKKAVERAGQAEAKLETVDKLLGGLADVDDESLAAARERVDAMRELAAAVAAAVPEWERARATAGERAAALAALDAELGVLAGVRPPDGTAELARAVAQARVAADEAAAAVGLAEEREEKLRGELAAAGDESALRLHLKAYADRDRLTAEAATVRAAVDAARGEHDARGGGAGGGAGGRAAGRDGAGVGVPRARGGEGRRPGGGAAGAPGRRRALPGVRADGHHRAGGAEGLGGEPGDRGGQGGAGGERGGEAGGAGTRRRGPRAGPGAAARPDPARPARRAPGRAGRAAH